MDDQKFYVPSTERNRLRDVFVDVSGEPYYPLLGMLECSHTSMEDAAGFVRSALPAVFSLYNAPRRHYHTSLHLANMASAYEKELLDKIPLGCEEAGILGLAILFHDVSYRLVAVPKDEKPWNKVSNELHSARIAAAVLGMHGYQHTQMVVNLVLQTDYDVCTFGQPPRTWQTQLRWLERQVLCDVPSTPLGEQELRLGMLLRDLDLSNFGDELRFRNISALISQEYLASDPSHTTASYREKRLAFLQKLAEAPRIYSLNVCCELWEAKARVNLEREIDSLTHLIKSS